MSPAALRALRQRLPGIVPALIVEAPSAHARRPPSWLQQLLRPSARPSLDGTESCLQRIAHGMGIPAVWCRHGDDSAVVDALRRARIDVAVCAGLPFLLSARMRDAMGEPLNAHPSALPRWRGAAPLFWWLRSGQGETAVSVHRMDGQFDHGDVLAQRSLAPPMLTSGVALLQMAGTLAGQMLADAALRCARGQASATPQAHVQASWAPKPRPEDAFVAPQAWPCTALARFLSGAPAFCTPSMVLAQQRYFVRRAVAVRPGERLPGDYLRVGQILYVAAQDGVVAVEVQH